MISPNRECSAFPIKIKIDKADVGLENVDNTADLDKPISNAVRDYLDGAKDSVSTNVALAKEYADNAKTSETNCETIEAKIEALNVATVDTAQNITGAKTFAGETTITGPLGVSGDTALSGKVTVEKELNVDSNGIATLNGKVTASNTGNSLKVANHDTALISNDVLSAKDINTPNGDANNLLHRSGDETRSGILDVEKLTENIYFPHKFTPSNITVGQFCEFLKIERKSMGAYHIIEFIQSSNTGPCFGRLLIHENNGESVWIDRCFVGSHIPLTSNTIHICTSSADNYLHFFYKRISVYGGIMARRVFEADYSTNRTNNGTTETWIPLSDLTVVDDIPDTMTEITIKEPYQA